MPTSIPASLGPYAVLEQIEARAFTVTYRAEQRRIGRTVRLEALKPTVSVDSPFAADLERQGAVLARLDHEGVIRLLDVGRTADALYLVLEDITGAKLRAVLDRGPMDVDAAAAVALAVARALAHLHERGVILRGLSADAVTLTARGRVVLTDLSAATLTAARDDLADRTESPAPPSYLAPEQILGEPAGPRSDVWALGVILHEMLAGSRPFDADDPRLLASRIRTEPPAPLPASVPPPIARLVTRCLAKIPDDRHPDAGAVASALEEILLSRTRLPAPVLATRALAAARLGDALPAPAFASGPEPRPFASGPDLRRAAVLLGFVFALIVSGGASIRLIAAGDEDAPGDGVPEATLPGSPHDRGHLRVVARPWAEVFLDGELVDTTPIGRPIAVAPGKHFVTFRHPSAPDEQRTIKVAAGQAVFLDVTMRVDRGDAGAGRADAGPVTPPSP